ncbi:MAG: bifunctional adenosylcobinamide kinase/adenosylcobinamide-phosphate guanylyltransferase [Candidatus Delongbacteria bacterium]|nr:MAG: bifunctional adenosylcobinamide kinase/adenosylcobinamide-phosphate guanylyltransferase [Candidatus Delongbacteria bacterium]
MKKITLVLGGIRSGKSVFAEKKAKYYSKKPVYIATAIPFDNEMRERIRIHQERRKEQFDSFEEPENIVKVLENLKDRTVLVDCLTINLSNIILKNENLPLSQFIDIIDTYVDEIDKVAISNNLNIIMVSNEVGTSPVEPNKLGRIFQDLQGRLNRKIGELANEVYFVRAGIPSIIKKVKARGFKIGSTSYVFPAGYVENMAYLVEKKVEDVQLFLYDSLNDDGFFTESNLMSIEYLVKNGETSLTAHMQANLDIFTDEGFEKSLEYVKKVFRETKRLPIEGFTFHFDLPKGKKWETITKEDLKLVEDRHIKFFKAIRKSNPEKSINLENVCTPISALDRVVYEADINFCIDIGHIIIQGYDLKEVKSRLSKATVVHIHGVRKVDGKLKDHLDLNDSPEIFSLLEGFKGVVTIENYHPLMFKKSRELLDKYF